MISLAMNRLFVLMTDSLAIVQVCIHGCCSITCVYCSVIEFIPRY